MCVLICEILNVTHSLSKYMYIIGNSTNIKLPTSKQKCDERATSDKWHIDIYIVAWNKSQVVAVFLKTGMISNCSIL